MKRQAKQKVVREKTPEELFHEKFKTMAVHIPKQSPLDFSIMNEKQMQAYMIVKNFIKNREKEQLLLILLGPGGTGKTHCLKNIRSLLTENRIEFKVASFTGMAGFLAYGSTLHSAFGISLNYRATDPRDIKGKPIREKLAKLRFLIIDEFSMLGCYLFGFISERLREVHKNERPFGNCSVILSGDHFQLKPLMDRALYRSDDGLEWKGMEKIGHECYRAFNQVVVFQENVRVQGEEESKVFFRELLLKIRLGLLSDEDFNLLNNRWIHNLSAAEVEKFCKDDVVALFAERKQAEDYNRFRVERLGEKVQLIYPRDSRPAPPAMSIPLLLAKKARVSLTINLSIAHGLFNGSRGTVVEIVQPPPGRKFVEVIFIKFDKYFGERFGLRPLGEIPILRRRTTEYDELSGKKWTRLQFPISLSFGLTCHRAQGSQFEKVLIVTAENPRERSMFNSLAPEIMYVSLSRCTDLESVAFRYPFQRRHVIHVASSHREELNAEEERLIELERQMQNL